MRRTRIVVLTAAMTALAAGCLLAGCASTQQPTRDDPLIVRIRRELPQDWTCTIQQESGRKGHPHGLEEPLFRADLTNPRRTFEKIHGKRPKELNPLIQLYFYDIRSKAHIMEVIEKERLYSWDIPIYFGETSQYVVVTSPAYVNHGTFTRDAKQAIRPAWRVLRKHIENKEDTTVDQLAGGGSGAESLEAGHVAGEIAEVSIRTPTSWLLRIRPDGSGQVGHGATRFAKVPKDTFNFEGLRKKLRAICVSKGFMTSHYAVAFVARGATSATSVYCSDSRLMHELFAKAVKAGDPTKRMLGDLYTTRPPVPGDKEQKDAVPAVKGAQTQAEALRLARLQDLPAIRQADRLVIKMAAWAGSKELVVQHPKWLARINGALVLSEVAPSGGETWATLTWYKGEQAIRAAWVFNYGEWGFERPSTDWTLGRKTDLATLIREALAPPAGSRQVPNDT